jgi:outer membrane protein
LALAEALTRARTSSPAYRQALNDAGPARWAVRSAYGQFIPRLDVGGDLGYVGAGSATFGGSLFNQISPSVTSTYGVELGLTVDGTVLTAPGQQKANQRAVEEDISNATIGLVYDVTSQYLVTLQAVAQTDVARQQVVRNTDFLELAQAQLQVGRGTLLAVRQAEVTRGQSEIDLLRNYQLENEAKLELLRRMGVQLPVPVTALALTDSFPVTEPTFQLEELLRIAEEHNPVLRAERAREQAAGWSVKSAKSQYLPSLRFTAGWYGFTQEFTDEGILLGGATTQAQSLAGNCEFQNALISELPSGGVPGFPNNGIVPDCRASFGLDATGETLLPETQSAILQRNGTWPFDYTRQPFRAAFSVSLPIFEGFSRNLQVAEATAARDDAEEEVRARALQVATDVRARFLGLETAFRAIPVQEANRTAALEQLLLSQERFRLGSGSALEVSDAQAAVQRAEGDYVNAVYAYHRAIAALEFAVGRPLR